MHTCILAINLCHQKKNEKLTNFKVFEGVVSEIQITFFNNIKKP